MAGKETGGTANFDLYDRLDRLEELIEDMTDLGIESREQAEAELLQIHARLDESERSDG